VVGILAKAGTRACQVPAGPEKKRAWLVPVGRHPSWYRESVGGCPDWRISSGARPIFLKPGRPLASVAKVSRQSGQSSGGGGAGL